MNEQRNLELSYALGAYETVRSIRDIAEKLNDVDSLKGLIRNEYNLRWKNLHSDIMKDMEGSE